MHFDGVGKGIFHAPKFSITEGSDLNALQNALKKQQEDWKNGISKLRPIGKSTATQHLSDPSEPSQNGEAASAKAPVPDSAPDTNGANQQNGDQKQNIFQKAKSGIEDLNKPAFDSVHHVTHDVVEHVPGGHQATDLTHGLIRNFVAGSSG